MFFRVQVREHLTRDQRPFLHPESLQTLQIHSFFSSVHLTHVLQGSGQRTPDERSETIPSSRITPDLQIHFFSSVHSLIFYRVQLREDLTRDQRPFLHPESLQIFRFTASSLQFTSLVFYRVQVREHLTRDQRPFLHPESLQIFRFTASPLQFTHSSSTGFRSENTWHEIRDHSFIQNHSRSSDSQLLLFSSPHSSSTGFRSENTWHEIRDHSFIQNHSRSSDSQLLLFSSPHSSSTGFRSENTWPEIRDHSFIQNHSRSFRFTASPLLFISLIFYRVQIREHLTRDQRPFLHPESLQILQIHSFSSSVHLTHLLQGSGQRTPDTRSETIPSSRITPDLQIHSFSSSVHLTHLLQGSDQRTPDTRSETIPSSRITPDLQIHSFFSSVHLTHLLQGSVQRTPDTRSETIPSSRITPDPSDSQLLLFSSPHSSSTGFRSENTWHEIRDHSFIQNHSRSSDSQLLLFSSLIFYRVQIREHLTRDQRPFLHPESLQIFRFTASSLQFTSLIFYRVQVREHLTRDQRPFLHPESLQIFRFTASSLQFTSLIFYRVQVREHLTRDQRPFLHPESLQIFRFTASPLQFTSLIFYRVQIREHLTRDQRPFLHPESLQIFRFTASSLQFTSLIFYRVQVREHLTRDQRPFLHPESLQIFRFTASSFQFTHLLQGSDQRTPDTRSETIPSSRITPDLQIHSFFFSVHSLIFYRVQVREHLTWDQRPFLHPESLQTLQIHSFFSSVHLTHLLQGSGQRTPDERSETIPSSRITPDLQIHFFSSVHSLIFYRVQLREDLTRDQRHSFIQNLSRLFRLTASPLQFTSLIFYTLQGSDQITPDTRSETIPSSRISPDPSDSQLLLFSSPHSWSTGFRSEDWNDQQNHFCVVFEVCVWIIVRLEDTNMAHYKISNRVSHLLIYYLLVFDRIMMPCV